MDNSFIYTGHLDMGDSGNVECATIRQGKVVKRYITIESFIGIVGFGSVSKGVKECSRLLSRPRMYQEKSELLLASLNNPHQVKANGVYRDYLEAPFLIEFANLMLNLRRSNVLGPSWKAYCNNCERFIQGLAKTGIVSLIDEATGYKKQRTDEYKRLFLSFVREDHSDWIKEFQQPFFDGIYKIDHLPPLDGQKRPPFFGAFISKYVYYPLANSHGAILEKLREKDPVVSMRGRKYKLHQFLTEEVGKPALRKHLNQVETLLLLSRDKGSFKRNFKKVFPQPYDQLELDFGDDV